MNATNVNLTEKSKAVLNVIAAGFGTRDEIAQKMGVSVPVVNGSLTSLKRNGLVDVDEDGAVVTTPDANEYIDRPSKGKGASAQATRSPRAGSKMEQARDVFSKFIDNGRQTVLEKFRSIGLTNAGAATYFQTIRHEAQMAGASFQKGRSKAATKASVKTVTKRVKK